MEQFPHEVMRIFPFLVNFWSGPAPSGCPWLVWLRGAVVAVIAACWRTTSVPDLVRTFPAHFDISVPCNSHERLQADYFRLSTQVPGHTLTEFCGLCNVRARLAFPCTFRGLSNARSKHRPVKWFPHNWHARRSLFHVLVVPFVPGLYWPYAVHA